MSDLITGLALVLVLEGLFYAAFPHQAKRMMAQMIGSPDQMLRIAGLGAMALGVLVVWLVRG